MKELTQVTELIDTPPDWFRRPRISEIVGYVRTLNKILPKETVQKELYDRLLEENKNHFTPFLNQACTQEDLNSKTRTFFLVTLLPGDINVIAIALIEFFGLAFFLLAFVFIEQSRRVGSKLEALQEAPREAKMVSEGRDDPCYSYKWAMSHGGGSKKLLHPGIFSATGLILLTGGLALAVGLTFLIILSSVGYILFASLIGSMILLETNAFEAYSYVSAVHKVEPDQLVEEDQSYMEIANKALEISTIRFLITGATFALVGPFVPQIFDGLCYALALYMEYTLFQVVKPVWNISQFLAMFIALILPGILLYLPALGGKILLRKMKKLI